MILLEGKCKNVLIEIPLSHRDLAQFAQITPETLSRTLRALENRVVIKVEKNGLRVMQAEAGADCIFFLHVSTRETIGQLASEIKAPVSILAGLECPVVRELEELGVAR